MKVELTEYEGLPDGFLTVAAADLYQVLPGPSLIHLPGERAEPLFVSVLLHGNETTGFEALQLLLREFKDSMLPRALSIFVGNVNAARHGLRVMPDGPDFNRIWPDATGRHATLTGAQEAALTTRVVTRMRERNLFASIDLHNTSGRNPHHACVTKPNAASLHLASLFSRQILYFETPRGVQNMAFDALCPAMTGECGQAGKSDGVSLTHEFLHRCIHIDQMPTAPPEGDFELYRSIATVKVPAQVDFEFGMPSASLSFVSQMDGYNWREISAGTQLAELNGLQGLVLDVRAPDGRDVSAEFLVRDDKKLLTKRSLVPAMLSLDKNIVRQDCLCYFLERVS